MYLRALTLRNFRLYEKAHFQFSPKINVIRGSNARGKTTLLEAIFFLITGRSFRTSQTTALIRYGSLFFYLDAIFIKNGIEQRLSIAFNGRERKITYNGNPSQSPSLFGLIQGVVMHPDDAEIVKGAPAGRRQVLDLQLAQADPLYVYYLTRYEQAMRQRNALLRAFSTAAIESWEYEMANAASYIIQKRALITDYLCQSGNEFYRHICGGSEEFLLFYKPHGVVERYFSDLKKCHADASELRNLYIQHYCKQREREMALGATLTGPHKDDLMILIGEKDTRLFASEGQQRSCIAALRLAEWDRLQKSAQEIPLLLIDDLGVSLDASRRSAMLEHLAKADQVFITTTEETAISKDEHVIQI